MVGIIFDIAMALAWIVYISESGPYVLVATGKVYNKRTRKYLGLRMISRGPSWLFFTTSWQNLPIEIIQLFIYDGRVSPPVYCYLTSAGIRSSMQLSSPSSLPVVPSTRYASRRTCYAANNSTREQRHNNLD